MLAALLLNLGSQAPQAPVGTQFGGGPFWRRYGYDYAYDEIRNQTSSAIESIPVHQRAGLASPELVRVALSRNPEPPYRKIESVVSKSVIEEMHRLRKEIAIEREEFEDELMIFLLGE